MSPMARCASLLSARDLSARDLSARDLTARDLSAVDLSARECDFEGEARRVRRVDLVAVPAHGPGAQATNGFVDYDVRDVPGLRPGAALHIVEHLARNGDMIP